jgi:hypothetical protein
METLFEIIISILFLVIIGYIIFLLYVFNKDIVNIQMTHRNPNFKIRCLDENETITNYKWMRRFSTEDRTK